MKISNEIDIVRIIFLDIIKLFGCSPSTIIAWDIQQVAITLKNHTTYWTMLNTNSVTYSS